MRILRINDEIVDIDEKTSIGITFQSFDFKEPAKRKINYSNNFTIPKTDKNLRICGFPGHIHFNSTTVYERLRIDYYIDNEHIINNSYGCIENVTFSKDKSNERIELYIYNKIDFWDSIKTLSISTFETELFDWLVENGLPDINNPHIFTQPYNNGFSSFLSTYIDATEGVIIPYFASNAIYYDGEGYYAPDNEYLELPTATPPTICLFSKNPFFKSGHICVYIKTIFKFLEDKYSINFLTDGGEVLKNAWDDDTISACYIPLRDIGLYFINDFSGVYFRDETDTTQFLFKPHENLLFAPDKTVSDLVIAFIQHFNLIIDEQFINGETCYSFHRFDDITDTDGYLPIDWSGGTSGDIKFMPKIDGLAKKNYIKFAKIYENGAENVSQKTITCYNENIDNEVDLFTIDAFIPAYFTGIVQNVFPNMGLPESFETFTFFKSTEKTTYNFEISLDRLGLGLANEYIKFYLPEEISLNTEYIQYKNMVEYPKVFEIKKWLKFSEITALKFFRQYWINELGASFFINKISGFNPDKSLQPCTIELILSSYQTPPADYGVSFWADGIGDIYTDGINEFYF